MIPRNSFFNLYEKVADFSEQQTSATDFSGTPINILKENICPLFPNWR